MFIHVVSWNNPFIFAALWYSVYEYTTFINTAIDGHLVYFQFGAISSNVTMTFIVHFFWCTCIDILDKYGLTNKIAWS